MTFDRRYSTVPWLSNSDLEEGRRCCWEIEYRRNEDRASCWMIDDPFHKEPRMFMVIHAVRGNGNDGGKITVALSATPRYDVYAQQSFALAHIHQSNPRRTEDDAA